MSNLESKIQLLEDKFSAFNDWEDKYKFLIDLGKDLDQMPAEFKSDQNLVKGCVSRVWIFAELEGANILFFGDSDAAVTKGIVALLVNLFSDCPPLEIMKNDFSFIDNIGLRQHLSLNRANGLASMIKQIKIYAMAFQAKLNL